MNDSDCAGKKVKCKTLLIDGTKYRTTLNKKYLTRKPHVKQEKSKIYSFIPGTVVRLDATVGQCVKKGDSILVLDAMKMENIILSPLEGIVMAINVKEGEKVPKGKLMVELGFG
jgi:biotin carboxyl carrier protein